MNIIVLVKQVPDTAQLSSTMDGLKLLHEGPRVINPWDEYAIEAALQLKESHGGKVTLLCLGPVEAIDEALKRGLAMGADEAILISDPTLAGGDSLTTARVLAAAINKLGVFDLIIAGRSGVGSNTGATAIQLAALLNVPALAYVAAIKAVDPNAGTISVVRLIESGRERVSSRLPAVMTVVKEINEPRYPSLIGLRRASKINIPVWDIAALGLEAGQVGAAGSRVSWPELSLPPTREEGAEIIAGPPAQVASLLVDKLITKKIL